MQRNAGMMSKRSLAAVVKQSCQQYADLAQSILVYMQFAASVSTCANEARVSQQTYQLCSLLVVEHCRQACREIASSSTSDTLMF